MSENSQIYISAQNSKEESSKYQPDFELVRAPPSSETKSKSICKESMIRECKLKQSDMKTINAFISLPPMAEGFLDCTRFVKCTLELPLTPSPISALRISLVSFDFRIKVSMDSVA